MNFLEGDFSHLKKCLIWTRSIEDFKKDEEFLPKAPWFMHFPCIKIQPLDSIDCSELEGKDKKNLTWVFTSSNASRIALPIFSRFMDASQKMFTVGITTATPLLEFGFSPVFFPNLRTAQELGKEILKATPKHSTIILPGPTRRAYDLERELLSQYLSVLAFNIYETIPCFSLQNGKPPTLEEKAQLQSSLNGVICFASPSAVLGFLKGFPLDTNPVLFSRLQCVCIGPTTQEEAKKYFLNCKISSVNSLKSLVEEASELLMEM